MRRLFLCIRRTQILSAVLAIVISSWAGFYAHCGPTDLVLECTFPSSCSVDVDDDAATPYVRIAATVTDGDGNPVSGGSVAWSIVQGSGALGDWGYPNTAGNGPGVWSAYYNPDSAVEQTHKIKAVFTGGGYDSAEDTINITVRRPTRINLIIDPSGISINETTEIYTTLIDEVTGDVVSGKEIVLTTDAPCAKGVFEDEFGGCSGNSVLFWYSDQYLSTGYTPLSGDPATHTITAYYYLYVGSKYSASEASVTLNVLKRLVEIDVSCTDPETADATHTCTVTVTDSNKNDGDPITPTGEVQASDQSTLCVLSGSSDRDATGVFYITTSTGHPEIVVAYYPGDASHYPMVASPVVLGGDPSALNLVPVFSLIGAYQKMCWGLSLAASLTGNIGSTVCAWLGVADISDIAGAACTTVVNAAVLAINTAQSVKCKDWDADGIYDEIEEIYCNNAISSSMGDSDGDTLGDSQEIGWAGGWMDTNPDDGLTFCPSPGLADSDGDGLDDGEELKQFQTDFCLADTDGDGLGDCDEVGTFYGATARALTADHADPLVQDTDGDGLSDDIEFDPGDLATSITDTTYSPFVNDADSDDDGLQDGIEDINGNGEWDGTVGGTGTTGSGETHLCLADTDGDGLLDGEEEALFGRGGIDVHSTLGTITTPALDDDSDDDGLSDYEEQVVTGTNPLNWDSDGDGLSDADELIVTGGAFPNRSFYQESDPRNQDTDNDGLPDNIEYPGTGVTRNSTASSNPGTPDETCPFANDDDSDDDGLQDGYEDKNQDGIWNSYVIGDSMSAGSGETDPCNPDTDSDGLSDGEEEGLIALFATSQGVSTTFGADGPALAITIPALDDDSDNDGLSDYEEVNITGTDPLDADTDNDTLSDANELIATGGTWPNRTFIQVSDPLDPDTDDDDLHDYIEYPGTGLGITRTTGGTPDNLCPYVNDDDSDDDGLQDGTEDANHDGTWGVGGVGITVGSFGTQAVSTVTYWETDLCNPDTDGDGLLDGEEVALIGGEPILGRPRPVPGFSTVIPEGVSAVLPMGTGPAGSPPGTGNSQLGPYVFIPVAGAPIAVTIPALDVDSDNDGLSDYEEVNITGTDPLDQDSDNDTLMDSDELIATGGTPGATPRRTFDQESNPLDINTDDDHLFDPQEYAGSGLSLLAGGLGGARDIACPYINDDDSDNDSIQDGAVITVVPAGVITSLGVQFMYIHYEDFVDIVAADVAHPGVVRTVPTSGYGEQNDDPLNNVCDCDSDGDGLNDGEEVAIGTDPGDWDTDNDGRNDWHEVTGGGPTPTDPFDPDTDDDGLLDSAEVFGANPTNPLNADTDGDGLCDGGAGTPWMMSGDARVMINPICKSCNNPITDVGLDPCGISIRAGSVDGIGDHPNLHGYGEDKNGNGTWEPGGSNYWRDVYSGDETDPNQYDTDGDAVGDGIEVLGFSTSRQGWIPTTDQFGRSITVIYPSCGCLNPLDPDSDDDGLSDGYEDANHDGNFDFLPSDFDFEQNPLPGPPQPNPNETNPCDADTDDDDLTDYEERYQSQVFVRYPDLTRSFNPTNPLDHDTDNDWLLDGFEVKYVCTELECGQLDNDEDGLLDEDPIDGIDNDGDGLIDEDPVDFTIRFVPMLDPTNRDSDSDGFIDGLDDDPCNSECIPVVLPLEILPVDTDGDGFSDEDEIFAGTHPNDPEDHPIAFCNVDLDFDQWIDDRIWLEPSICCGIANSVAIDIDNNVLIDFRLQIVQPRDIEWGDFDGDGVEDDVRYVVEYAFANYRVLQPRIVATIDDYNADLVIDWVIVERK